MGNKSFKINAEIETQDIFKEGLNDQYFKVYIKHTALKIGPKSSSDNRLALHRICARIRKIRKHHYINTIYMY